MAYAFNDDKTKLQLADYLRDLVYPVGSIYMSVNNTNPSSVFGGTWVAWGSGRVPVGVNANDTSFNSVEKTGGEKTHTLTAAESGMPAHYHGGYLDTDHFVMNDNPSARNVGITDGTDGDVYYIDGQSAPEIKFRHRNRTGTVAARNATNAHNNLQPYITCYMWKRTA